MDAPTPAEVRGRSQVLAARYPTPADGEDESADFVAAVEDSSALVAGWTGRAIGEVAGEEVPAGLVGIARRAVAKAAERLVLTASPEQIEKAATAGRVRSISAGPWSESYFAPGELSLKNGAPVITGDAELDMLLNALMTDDRRDELVALATGRQAPSDAMSSFDYRRQGAGFGRPTRWGVGPDGW